jgi:hypothetical protein
VLLVDYGFATTNSLTGQRVIPENMKKQILNMDKTCLLLDESNGNSGGWPTVTYYDFPLPSAQQKSDVQVGTDNDDD